jgi:hypothetical protein
VFHAYAGRVQVNAAQKRIGAASCLVIIGVWLSPLSLATPQANAATEVTTTVTSNDPPRENAPCFDGTGHWLKFTPGGRGFNQIKKEVGAPGSPTLTYDEYPGIGGFPVFNIQSLIVDGVNTAFSDVWVYPGGRTAYVFASGTRFTTAPTVLAPRSGRNITQVFLCAAPIVVHEPCPGGQYFWSQDPATGTKLYPNAAVTIDTGVDVPAGVLKVVTYVSTDGYPTRPSTPTQPNERWRVVVGAVGTGFTDDLADGVVSDTRTGSLGPVSIGAGRVIIEHYSVSTLDISSQNSVVPVSICFRVD